MIAVRLSDLRPHGRIARVTYGLLDLCHRRSHEEPEPVVPGTRTRVRVRLNDIGYRFPAGHRLRLQISTSYWPVAWPAPCPVRLTVLPASSHLLLPVRPPQPTEEAKLRPFDPSEATYAYRDEDPTSARGEVRAVRRFARDGWEVHTKTRTVLTCTPRTSGSGPPSTPTRVPPVSRR